MENKNLLETEIVTTGNFDRLSDEKVGVFKSDKEMAEIKEAIVDDEVALKSMALQNLQISEAVGAVAAAHRMLSDMISVQESAMSVVSECNRKIASIELYIENYKKYNDENDANYADGLDKLEQHLRNALNDKKMVTALLEVINKNKEKIEAAKRLQQQIETFLHV